MAQAWYSDKDNYDAKVKIVQEALPKRLENLSKFLGQRCCTLGDRWTYVDYLLYTELDYVRLFQPEIFAKEPTLKAYMDRFEAQPNIQKYISDPNFRRQRVTGPIATWSGVREWTQSFYWTIERFLFLSFNPTNIENCLTLTENEHSLLVWTRYEFSLTIFRV